MTSSFEITPSESSTFTDTLNKHTMTVGEAAEILGVSEWALRKAINAGTAPIKILRVGRRIVVTVASLREALGLN